ncbi:MAG: 5'/3'-nucleotidase SurE [Planctomycetota bacterium]
MKLRSPFLAFAVGTLLAVATLSADEMNMNRPRILVTNDNGIDDPKVIALARGLSSQAEVWLVAPDSDQSGIGAHLTVPRTRKLDAEPRDIDPEITAFAVKGTPGDCVVFALSALMADNPPDLVISGINGGPNLGTDWLYSGTIGAARVAAYGGVPAVAVSGLDDDLPGAVDAAVAWVVKLSGSDAVKSLRSGEYLTVSLPRIPPEEIRGVKYVDRDPRLPVPQWVQRGKTSWELVGMEVTKTSPSADADRIAVEQGYIAVVPMSINEVESDRLRELKRHQAVPAWKVVRPASRDR